MDYAMLNEVVSDWTVYFDCVNELIYARVCVVYRYVLQMFGNETSETLAFLDDSNDTEYKDTLKATLDPALLPSSSSLGANQPVVSSSKRESKPQDIAQQTAKRGRKASAVTDAKAGLPSDGGKTKTKKLKMMDNSPSTASDSVLIQATALSISASMPSSSSSTSSSSSSRREVTPQLSSALARNKSDTSPVAAHAADSSLQLLKSTCCRRQPKKLVKKTRKSEESSPRIKKDPEYVGKYDYLLGSRHDDPDEPDKLFETTRVLCENELIVGYRKRVLRSGHLAKLEEPYCLHIAAVASMTKRYEKQQATARNL